MLLGFLGNDLLYIAGDIYHGESLGIYKTNGNIGAGELVLSFNQPGSFLVAYPMTITMDNVLYFIGSDENAGFELWRTDGTSTGTYLVKDINPGIESSLVFSATKQYFAQLNGFIYFGASEPVNGCELWKSDGTEAGTTLVANIDTSEVIAAHLGSNPVYLFTYNNAVYFSAYRPVDGRELWKSDGTEAGTVLVKDIAPGGSSPSDLMECNGSLYFTAYYPDQAYTLFKSDGTMNGTVVVEQPNNGGPTVSYPPVVFNNKLYFGGYDQLGTLALWYSDGTAAGTNFLPVGSVPFNSAPMNLLATTNYLYFNASDDQNTGIYRLTTQNQITKLTNSSFDANVYHRMFLVNNCVLARGEDGNTGEEIYAVCGQNTQPVGLEESALGHLTVFPNPCKDQFTIESSSDLNDIDELSLQNLSGRSINLNYSLSNQHILVVTGLSDLSSGVYFLSIRTKTGESKQVKLMIE